MKILYKIDKMDAHNLFIRDGEMLGHLAVNF